MLRQWLLCVVTITIAGCVNLKPVTTLEITTYMLDATVDKINNAQATSLSILINTPKASPVLETNKLAYIQQAHEIKYFAHNRWIDTPAQMLLPLLTQAIQTSGRFQAVVSAPFAGSTDLRLDTEVLNLQQEFFKRPSQIRLVVKAQLINLSNQRIIATRLFAIEQPATEDTPYGGVTAANQAVAKFLQQLTNFCTAQTLPQVVISTNNANSDTGK